MSRSRGARFWAGVCVALVLPLAARGQPLNAAIDRLVEEQRLTGAKVAVCAVDLESGVTLASLGDSEGLIPASNMKLLTSGAALTVLGEDFAFRTELVLSGTSLVIVGSGDPSLGDPRLLERSSPRMTVDEFLRRIGAAVSAAGVSDVAEVVVDNRVFDGQLVHPSWEPDDLVKAYAAPVCGVNFHGNVVTAYPSPSPSGGAPRVVFEPASPWIVVINKAKTGGKSNTSWILRDPTREVFTLFGEVSQRVAIDVALHDPARSMGRLLAAELLDAGVAVGRAAGDGAPGRLNRAYEAVRSARPGERFEKSRVLAVVSAPLVDVLRRCNADSSNLDAECLLKRIGHEVTGRPGSWENGASVLRMRLSEALGPEFAAETAISDGSGLSRHNRVSARTLARWLAAMASGPHQGTFVRSLASPGEGTLRRRFRDANLVNELYAKSGSIDGVRCLSGYVVAPESGRRIAFSILVNGLKGGQTQGALKLHERIVGELDGWLTARAQPGAAVQGG